LATRNYNTEPWGAQDAIVKANNAGTLAAVLARRPRSQVKVLVEIQRDKLRSKNNGSIARRIRGRCCRSRRRQSIYSCRVLCIYGDLKRLAVFPQAYRKGGKDEANKHSSQAHSHAILPETALLQPPQAQTSRSQPVNHRQTWSSRCHP